MSDNQLIKIEDNKPLSMSSISDMKEWYNNFVAFSKEILKKDLDYGVIPGVSKPSLFKPGAEKLRFVYNIGVEMHLVSSTENSDKGLLDYSYKCVAKSKSGQILSECEGNANSYETKYRYVWTATDKKPSKEEAEKLKAQKVGKWSKQGNDWVWMEKDTNVDVWGLKNTIMKMAQKRAFVGAILLATGASEFFTQDVEDMDIFVPEVEIVAVNKYLGILDKLLETKAITKAKYDKAVKDEDYALEIIKKFKEERESK